MEKCRDLKCYSLFVARVRDSMVRGESLKRAIIEAIHYCKGNNILKEYFEQKEQEEVLDMVSFKWNPDLARKTWEEEARKEGYAKGLAEGHLSVIRNLTETAHWTA